MLSNRYSVQTAITIDGHAAPDPTRALRLANRDHFTPILLLVMQDVGVGRLGVMPVKPVKAVALDHLPDCDFIDGITRHQLPSQASRSACC